MKRFIRHSILMSMAFFCATSVQLNTAPINKGTFKCGVENITSWWLEQFRKASIYSIGLVTNQTGKDKHGCRTVDLLLKKGLAIKYLFVPEHGFSGDVPAEKEVIDSIDKKTGIPIISLYGKGIIRKFNESYMQGLDAFFFDMQDAGMRHYTYITVLLRIMEIAVTYNKYVVVLDRPSLLGGVMEGPLVDPAILSIKSAIAPAAIPLRHGMTVGELARYFNNHVLHNRAKLIVVKMSNYDRYVYPKSLPQDIFLSPNIRSVQACFGYSFLGLLGEIRPFDVGIGTGYAFQCIMLPKNIVISSRVWKSLKEQCERYSIRCTYVEYYNERKKTNLHGIRFNFSNIHDISAFTIFITILGIFKEARLAMHMSPYFDRAVGTPLVHQWFEGIITLAELKNYIKKDLRLFYKNAMPSFLYHPLPIVKLL